MKISSLLSLSFLYLITTINSSGQIGWESAFMEYSSLSAQGMDVVTDSLGNVYVTGHFGGEAEFDDTTLYAAAEADIFTAKYDPMGSLLWINQAAEGPENYGMGISLDDSLNIFVAANNMILKYNSEGNLQWRQLLLTSYHWEQKRRVIATFQEKAVIAGRNAIHVFNSAGVELDQVDITVTCFSNFENGRFAAGNWEEIVIMDEDLQQIRTIPLPDGIENVWSIILHHGDLYFTGHYSGPMTLGDSVFTGSHNMMVARIDSSGQTLWANQGGGEGYAMGNALVINERDELFIAGMFNSIGKFDSLTIGRLGLFEEIFIANYDKDNGNLIDLISAGGGGNFDIAYGMASAQDNQLIVTGSARDFSNGVNFGDINVSSRSGNPDYFLASTSQPEVKSRIKGQVLKDGTPDYAWIKLYKIDGDTAAQQLYHMLTDAEGRFNLEVFHKGIYLLKAHYYSQSHISTYFENAFMWDQATSLLLDSDTVIDSLNINLIALPVLLGDHRISGNIYNESDSPLRFVEMVLVSADDNPVAYTRSDTAGMYIFNNIPTGEFKIWVDTAGLLMDEFYTVHTGGLKTSSEIYAGYDYYLKGGKVYTAGPIPSIGEYIPSDTFKVYPVPAKNILYIDSQQTGRSPVVMDIVDLNGKIVRGNIPGRNRPIDLSDLDNGIYILWIYNGAGTELKKFIILK